MGYVHKSDDVQGVQHGHHPMPPTMLMDSTVVAPLPDSPGGSLLRTLGRPLPLDEFLQIDPLSLGLRKQSRAGLRREVADDDTSMKC